MIVQCDECKAKFRLDESRIGAHGAKVRCSKCRHVFMVHPPQAKEEEEFDSFLDGLDGGVAAGGVAASDAAPAETAQDTSAVESGMAADTFTAQKEEVPDTSESSPGDEGLAVPGTEAAGDSAFDSGSDLFEADTAAEAPAAPGEFDFSDLNQPQESETENTDMFDGQASEFDFSAEGGDEFAASDSEAAGWGTEPADEFPDFGIGETSGQVPEEESAESGETPEPFDFESFGATEPSFEEKAEPDEGTGFGTEFNFGGIASEPSEESVGLDDSLESSFPSFDLESSAGEEEPGAVDEFTFEESAGENIGAKEVFDHFEPVDQPEDSSLFPAETAEPPDFSFDFDGSIAEDEVEPSPVGESEEDVQWDISPSTAEDTHGEPDAGDAALRDLAESFEGSPTQSEVEEPQEELPPLSIATRRKQSALVPIVATLMAIIVIGGIAGAGYYLFGGDPAALDRVGLGFVTKLLGMESKAEGNISVRKVSAQFTDNKAAGELFVVSGEALNNYRNPRASLQVKVVLYGKNGKVLVQKTAYCGNTISDEQLKVVPWTKIEAAMANQFGDSLVNLGVQPGKAIPFVVVFSQVPADVTDFAVEPAGSTVAGK